MDIVQTIFSVLDFLLVVGLLVYAWRVVIAPQLTEQMAQDAQYLQEQEDKKAYFKKQQAQIVQEKKEQKELFLDLQNKFGLWSGIVQEQYKQKHQDVCEQQVQVEKYTQQKKAYLQYHILMRRTVPSMIENIHHDIILYYKDTHRQQAYFQKSTFFMKELV